MNLKNSEEISKLIKENHEKLSKIIKEYSSINVDYNEENDFFNAVIELREIENYYYKDTSLMISFKSNGDILEEKCFECKDSFCYHTVAAHYLINKSYSQILDYFNVKITKTASELIANFKKKTISKELSNLSIILTHEINNQEISYNLDLKIGSKKEYVLKKQINEFLEIYESKNGEIVFGKDYTYNSQLSFFDSATKKIIEILPVILENDNHSYRQSKYTINSNYLHIKNSAGIILFNTLKTYKKAFTLNIKNKKYEIKEIRDDFYPNVRMESKDNGLQLTFDDVKLIPLSNDFSYILSDGEMYYLDEEKKGVLDNFRLCKSIEVSEDEIPDFNKYILPNIRRLTNNIEIDDELKDAYRIVKPIIKLYFDVNDEFIIVDIKATYGDVEVNIKDDKAYDKYNIVKDELAEMDAEEYIKGFGFVEDSNKKCYFLPDEELSIDFLENHIKLLKEYESFISNKLKEIKYIKRASVKSSISLDSGELLSCDFKINDINDDEIKHVLDAVRYKRKYYKLKNGSYLNIENNKDLNDLDNLLTNLNINYNDIGKKEIKIPKFKALFIASKKEEYNFLQTNNELEEFIENFKNSKGKKITIPTPSGYNLRDYQSQGIKWLQNIANYGFGCILADEMGLGKTLQTIMYIKARLDEDKKREILIVCPTSLIYNWEAEFTKFAPKIKVKVIAEMRQKREKMFNELKNYEVFITSYGLLREDIDKYKGIHYDTMIIDEAQAIKNTGALITHAVKEVSADIKIALTGTPIENSIMELYSIFDFIMPGFFGNSSGFSKKYDKISTTEDKNIKKDFNKLISPFILRRKKNEVMKELPDKIEENMIVDLDKKQKEIYLAEVNKITEVLNASVKEDNFNKNKLVILQYLTRLRQICISPSLYIDNYDGPNAKIDLLIDILKDAIIEHKILVFSQFTSALSIVAKKLKKEKIDYYYLDGSTKAKDRIELVNEFNENDINVFLISLKAGGNGLNLTGADIVIHLDPWWNPAVENQATDRAHRIGQKKVVEVIKLIAKGTIEEKIVKLQNMKKELSNQIIEGKENSDEILSKLTEKDIIYLLAND